MANEVASRYVRERVRASLFGSSPPPVRIGRFLVLKPIGTGGTGIVYAAYDAELDRKVALKLLHRAGDDAAPRLMREAKALARLAHPNAVQVYEVGLHDGHVFMAMELIEGRTLRAWLEETKPSRREVIEALVAAGHGLAAAHRAGLVHRDFKPDNVLMGFDGRIKVVDFGMARSAREPRPAGARPHTDDLAEITETGTRCGTPAYMSPEQLEGHVDARSDQFAFAVTSFEALFGARPFAGQTLSEVRANVAARAIRWPPSSRGVVRRALGRALALDPEQRFEDLDALLASLQAKPRPIGRWSAAVVVVAMAGAWLAVSLGEPRCAGARAAVQGVWSARARAEVEQAYSSSADARALRQVFRRLDGYAEAWAASRTSACEATRVSGRQSPAMMDLRMLCLDRRLSELDGFVQLLRRPRPGMAKKAVTAVRQLPPVERCDDIERLAAAVAPPSRGAVRSRVQQVRAELGRASSLMRLGRYAEAKARAAQAIVAARATGYPPVYAEAKLEIGRAEAWLQELDSAETHLQEAVELALASGHRVVAATAWHSLIWLYAYARADPDRGLDAARYARAVLEDQPGEDALLATVIAKTGWLHAERGDYARAVEMQRQGLAIRRRVLGDDHPSVAISLFYLGTAQVDLGAYTPAERLLREARAVFLRAGADDHPLLASAEQALALVDYFQRRYQRALQWLEQAEARFARTLPAKHPRLAGVWSLRARARIAIGDHDGAAAELDAAEPVIVEALGRDHFERAALLCVRGDLARARGDAATARRAYREALRLFTEAYGPAHETLAHPHEGLGRVALGHAEAADAERHLVWALELLTARYGAEHSSLLPVLSALARIDAGTSDSVARARRAVAIADAWSLSGEDVTVARAISRGETGRTARAKPR